MGGCAVDVFPKEPKANGEGLFSTPLQGCPNTILTPHIGGSTEEAQEAIGVDVSSAMIKFINTGLTTGAVNFPELELMQKPGVHRMLHVHQNIPGVLTEVNSAIAAVGANVT